MTPHKNESSTFTSTEETKKLSIAELLRRLASNENRLASSEAEKRLQQFGPNEIPEKKINPIIRFLGYFWGGQIPWMIEAAAIISAFIQHWIDFEIIFVLLMVNAVVGF
ncbi:MAG: cation-transporting P-type ATPase [Candidatus Bathyarchaeales archaeon]